MFHKIFIIILTFFGVQVNAAEISCEQPNTGKMSYRMLTDVLKTCNPSNIEDLLKVLPKHFRTGPAFVHTSRSLAKGTKERPRTILGESRGNGQERGKFIGSFGGDPALKGYQFFEFFELNENDDFDFGFVEFPKELDPNSTLPNYILSQKNPAKCMNCHNGSPIWDTYANWAGFVNDITAPAYTEFNNNIVGKVGRYKHVFPVGKNSAESFSDLVNWLQGSHIVAQTKREMAADPLAARFRFLLAVQSGHGPYCKPEVIRNEFIPPDVLAKLPVSFDQASETFMQSLTDAVIDINRRICLHRNYTLGENEDCSIVNSEDQYLFPEPKNNYLLIFAAQNAKLNYKNWSMVFTPNSPYTFMFRDNNSTINENDRTFRDLLSKEEQKLVLPYNCEALAEASRKAFNESASGGVSK